MRGLYYSTYLVLIALLLLIPFVFPDGIVPSVNLFGRGCGMVALVLIGLQFLLAGRPRFLGRTFSLRQLSALHKANGIIAVWFALMHPLLVYWPDLYLGGPVEWGQWPAVLGSVLLCILWATNTIAANRQLLSLGYPLWKWLHGLAALVLLLGGGLHAIKLGTNSSTYLGQSLILLLVLSAGGYMVMQRKKGA